MSILKILNEINSDTKKTHKIALVEQYKDNAQFMRVVKLALDPYINFYIKKIPDYSLRFLNGPNDTHKTLDWALAELEKLSSRELTGHAGIEHLRGILSSLSPDDAVVIERIIGKDLRCGMADGIVNAVSVGFIPSYPCLLARPYDAKNIKNITYPAYSQLKADGLRANGIVEGTKVTLCGRSGREIDLLGHMDADLILLSKQFPYPCVFDGEFVVVDANEKVIDRKTGNGIINKAIKGTISDEEAKQIRFQVWDVIPLDEFKAGASKAKYKDRFEALIKAVNAVKKVGEDALADKLKGIATKFWVIPYKVVNNLEEAETHFQELLSQGHEGTILKNYIAIWEDSRSKHLVKMKAELDCDLEIIGWNEGTGKFEGMVGSLQMASSDRLVEVNISGFSDDLRQWITDNINTLIGTIATVIYNERIKSRDRPNVDSLFLPRFAEFRSDKTVANSSKEIK
jgi:hypothetical protein